MMKFVILVVNKGCCLLWDFNMVVKLVEKLFYFVNFVNCFGLFKLILGRLLGGIFFFVMYLVKLGV